jgi:hypothetical protein
MAKLFFIIGFVFLLLGALLTWGSKLPFVGSLGRLPGDIRIEREGFRFYVPITSSILLSVILSLLLRALTKK